MPLNLPVGSLTVEIEFVTGSNSFLDITEQVDAVNGISVQLWRPDEFSDIGAGTLSLSLFNSSGDFTPDNPLSQYYPNIVEGRRIRFTYQQLPASSVQFFGTISTWQPDFPEGEPDAAVVYVTADDYWADLQKREMLPEFFEYFKTSAGTSCDLWAFNVADSSVTSVKALSANTVSATVSKDSEDNNPDVPLGSVEATTPDGVVFDGTVLLTADDTVGPVLVAPLTNTKGAVTEVGFAFRTLDRNNASIFKTLLSGVSSSGIILWELRLSENGAGGCDLIFAQFIVATGTRVSTVLVPNVAADAATLESDGIWRYVYFFYDAGTNTSKWVVRRADTGAETFGVLPFQNIRTTSTIIVGGRANSGNRAQSNCVTVEIGALAVANRLTEIGGGRLIVPNSTEGALTRISDLLSYAGGTVVTVAGTPAGTVMRGPTSGRSIADLLSEVARTLGVAIYPHYQSASNKVVAVKWADAMRSTATPVVVDAAADFDSSGGFPLERLGSIIPTRATVNWPAGSTLVVGDESIRRQDTQIDTCATNEVEAQAVGWFFLSRSKSIRITRLPVDLVHAASAGLSALFTALTPGTAVRLNGLPTQQIGWTYMDGFVEGLTTTWTVDSVRYDLDLSAPVPEGIWDTTRFTADGAFKVTGGTAVGNTGTGTVVITSSVTDLYFSTDAADYPMDLNWNGEIVTVAAAPAAGAAGQQTLTLSARGVIPSVARSHSLGEDIDVADASHWTLT